jgi:hypothetical protein
MVEQARQSPFGSLKHKKYLIIECLTNLDYEQSLKYLHSVNREGRQFLKLHFKTMQREFEN